MKNYKSKAIVISFLIMLSLGGIISCSRIADDRTNESEQERSWPMFKQNAQRTGLSPYVGSQNGTKKWEYETGGGIISSPAIGSDGTIYVGSDDKKLHAIN